MATNVENNNNRTDENPASVLTSGISCTDAAPSASTDASASASAGATRMSGHDDTATGVTTSANASICLHRKDGPVDASDGTTGSAEEHFDFNFDGDGNQALGGMIEPREKTRQLLEISESRDSKEYLHQDSIHHVAHINRREDDDEDEAEHDAEEEEGEVENPQENGGREMQPAIELDEGEELALALAVIRRQEMFTRPGAYFVPGINYRPPGSAQPVVASAAARNSTAANNVNNVQNPTSPAEETKEEIILEGFLAPEPRERAGANGVHSSNPNRDSPEETMEQKVQRIKRHLLANAISLDDSAVRTIPMKGAQTQTKEDHELNDDEKRDVKQSAVGNEETMADQSPPSRLSTRIMKSWTDASFFHRAAFLTVVALLCTAVIIFSLGFGTGSNRSGMSPKNLDHTSVFENPCNEEPSQLEGNATIRWNIARDIVSSITPSEALQNETSPQRKALRWIVCNDAISSKFLNQHDNQTLSPNNQHVRQTHAPPPQPTQATTGYGFVNSGNSGESQILRRYILATLYYSTSIDGPWQDDWNFLNGNQHECSWHKKYKRWNFQFEEVDPAGIVCQTGPWGDILLNDEEIVVGRMTVNFRIKNNLTGTLPPELGHLVDLADILIEQQEHLSGSLPPFMPNLTLIDSVSILFNGPDLGGEIPKSLLELPSFTYLTIKQNAGSWSLPENVDNISPNITNVDLSTSGFRGTIPRWIYESNVVILDLSFNEFQGAIFPEDEIIDFLPRIQFLNYHGNRHLYGTLPDALGRLGGTLKVLALGDNQIGGSLPESIGNLSNLELLSLNDNAMTGTLPATLANMTSLSHLVLSSNSFRGSVTVLESMKNLTTVLTHSNEFSGTLPGGIFDGVSSDASLYLDVGNNRFSGDIPASYGNVPNLTFFGATRNNFNDNTVHNATCDNIEFTIMDCSACSCCNVCCDASDDLNSGDICDFHMDSFRLLGLDCGPWWMYCNQPQTYYDVDPV